MWLLIFPILAVCIGLFSGYCITREWDETARNEQKENDCE
jgi:hypothetical protein